LPVSMASPCLRCGVQTQGGGAGYGEGLSAMERGEAWCPYHVPRRTLMRHPLVKRHTTLFERLFVFFPRSRAWRSRPSVSFADLISIRRCTPPWLHQTLIEALSPWQWRVPRDVAWSLGGLEIYPYPHTGLLKGVAERVPFASECQARERGSTRKPLTTLTVWERGRRMPCGLLLSRYHFLL
jgi:hypothetical protein